MHHSFVSSFPPQAQVGLPLNRAHHLYALMRELELLGYVIDQAAHHWEAVWHTKGYGPIGALRTMLQAHDRRVKLLGLHNPVPESDIETPPAASVQPAPESVPPKLENDNPAPVPETDPEVLAKLNPPPARPSLPPREVAPLKLLSLDGHLPDQPNRQRDLRAPINPRPPSERDYRVT